MQSTIHYQTTVNYTEQAQPSRVRVLPFPEAEKTWENNNSCQLMPPALQWKTINMCNDMSILGNRYQGMWGGNYLFIFAWEDDLQPWSWVASKNNQVCRQLITTHTLYCGGLRTGRGERLRAVPVVAVGGILSWLTRLLLYWSSGRWGWEFLRWVVFGG